MLAETTMVPGRRDDLEEDGVLSMIDCRQRCVRAGAQDRVVRVARRAFTLVELLVVVGIVALLASIGLVAGGSVVAGAQVRSTADTIRVLDLALNSYIVDRGALPPAFVQDPRVQTGPALMIPVADARAARAPESSGAGGFANGPEQGLPGPRMINSVGLVIQQMRAVPATESILAGIDSDRFRRWSPSATPAGENADNLTQPAVPTVFDAWGNPIRYVHPAWDGLLIQDPADPVGGRNRPINLLNPNQRPASVPDYSAGNGRDYWVAGSLLRRNNVADGEIEDTVDAADSDGGLCVGGRPYFYSAGPDGDPSTIEDNVYTVVPRFPAQ
ncbi:MAG: type II secretion system protein [Planctomycetota bacterium]